MSKAFAPAKRRLAFIMLGAAVLLMAPLVAMLFTSEVKWGLLDFLTAGVLLFGTGIACELVLRKVTNVKYRLALCAVILVILLLVWLELAVGVFGTPFAGS